jgi:hypothetical protein
MPQRVMTLDSTLRELRLIWGALLLSMLAYPAIAEWFGPSPKPLNPVFIAGEAASAAAMSGVALYFRTRRTEPALQVLRDNPDDRDALLRWRSSGIVTGVTLEALMLTGVALQFTGATLLQSAPFYVIAVALMMAWWPRRP